MTTQPTLLESAKLALDALESGGTCKQVSASHALRQAIAQGEQVPATPTVWYGKMPESNGRTNWTAIMYSADKSENFTLDRSEYPHRVRYAADCVRHILGELPKCPHILDYDADEKTPCHLCGGTGKIGGKACYGLNFDGAVHDTPTPPAEQPACEHCAASDIAVQEYREQLLANAREIQALKEAKPDTVDPQDIPGSRIYKNADELFDTLNISEPTPMVPLNDEAEYEIWQDGIMCAGSYGPKEDALREIKHYAAQYEQDGNVVIYEIQRIRIGKDQS